MVNIQTISPSDLPSRLLLGMFSFKVLHMLYTKLFYNSGSLGFISHLFYSDFEGEQDKQTRVGRGGRGKEKKK